MIALKQTTRQLIAYNRGAAAQIDRLSLSKKERRYNRSRLANSARHGRLTLGSKRQREHLLTCEVPK